MRLTRKSAVAHALTTIAILGALLVAVGAPLYATG